MILSGTTRLCWCYNTLCFRPADNVSAGACRGPGAGGDCTEMSAEWSLGRGALWSLWEPNKPSAAGLPMIQSWKTWSQNRRLKNIWVWYGKQEDAPQHKMAGMEEGSSSGHREIWIRDLWRNLYGTLSGAVAWKAAVGEQGESETALQQKAVTCFLGAFSASV